MNIVLDADIGNVLIVICFGMLGLRNKMETEDEDLKYTRYCHCGQQLGCQDPGYKCSTCKWIDSEDKRNKEYSEAD